MRISDWSSDVCSSDLRDSRAQGGVRACAGHHPWGGRSVCLEGRCPEQGHGAARHTGYAPRQSGTDHQGRGTCRSEEHTSELQSLMRISYAVFCLKTKKKTQLSTTHI